MVRLIFIILLIASAYCKNLTLYLFYITERMEANEQRHSLKQAGLAEAFVRTAVFLLNPQSSWIA